MTREILISVNAMMWAFFVVLLNTERLSRRWAWVFIILFVTAIGLTAYLVASR